MHLSFDASPCQRITTVTLYCPSVAELPLAPLKCILLAQEQKDSQSLGQMVTLQECCAACREIAPLVSILAQDDHFDEHGIAHATVQILLSPEHNHRPPSMEYFLCVKQETAEYGPMQSNTAQIPLRPEQQCYVDQVLIEECEYHTLDELPKEDCVTVVAKTNGALLRKQCVAVRWGDSVYTVQYTRNGIQFCAPAMLATLAQKHKLYSLAKRHLKLLNAEEQPIGNERWFS